MWRICDNVFQFCYIDVFIFLRIILTTDPPRFPVMKTPINCVFLMNISGGSIWGIKINKYQENHNWELDSLGSGSLWVPPCSRTYPDPFFVRNQHFLCQIKKKWCQLLLVFKSFSFSIPTGISMAAHIFFELLQWLRPSNAQHKYLYISCGLFSSCRSSRLKPVIVPHWHKILA